jgi:hypothetical protein
MGVIGNAVLADGEDARFNFRHQINYTTDNLQLVGVDQRFTALSPCNELAAVFH